MAKTGYETLDEIADRLLSGEITNEEAGRLAKNIPSRPVEMNKPSLYKVIFGEDCLRLRNRNNNELGYINFYFGEDSLGQKYSCLNEARTFNPGNGHFSLLFDAFSNLCRRKDAEYISLEVDRANGDAISIYEHLGFMETNSIETVSENTDRIQMRYDLDF
jgi:hypothetical protein